MSDNSENEPIRHSISFPQDLYDEVKKISEKQFRSFTSVVLEACQHYVSGDVHKNVTAYLRSQDGRDLIRRIMEEEHRKK